MQPLAAIRKSKPLPTASVHILPTSPVTHLAGAMTSPSILCSQSQPKPGRRSRRAEEGEELEKKPKKVNSEVRKQQNRIASRNYRTSGPGIVVADANVWFYAGEKRKRKLQYLQKLIRDGSNDEQTPEPSPHQHEAHLRSLSSDYESGPSSSPYLLPSNSEFVTMSTSGTIALGPAPAATTASFDTHLLPTTQAYSPYPSPWNSTLYDPPPAPSMTWNVPTWMSSTDYSPRVVPRPENFHFSPPLGASQPVFEQTPSPYHHPRELVVSANHYGLGSPYGHYNVSPSQTPGVPSVSLPTLSSYFQGHYPGRH
jgi:hypothetical protein